MSTSGTITDPCNEVSPDSAQEKMAPFLRPTIGPNDETWVNVASMDYQDKRNLIEYATTTVLPPPALVAGGVTPTDDREDANAFGTAILAEFDQYLANNDIVDEYYCAAVNFLAFAKWSDLDAFERIEAEDFVGDGALDKQCHDMLDAAMTLGLIDQAPLAYILNFPRIEVRIFPYTPLIAIFLNPKRPVSPEDEISEELFIARLFHTVAHEVAHYLFWYANIGGLVIEAWARAVIYARHDLNETEKGVAYRDLEELFCDAVGVVVGGVKCAQSLIEAIGKFLSQAVDDLPRVRLISILRGVKTFFEESYEDLKGKANVLVTRAGQDLITDDEVNERSEPYLDPIWQEEMQGFLQTYHEGTQGNRAVIDAVSSQEVADEILGQIEGLEGDDRYDELTRLYFAKLAEIEGGPTPSASLATVGLARTATRFDPADLIQKFKDQWNSAPLLAPFPYEWFGVLLAAGWSNRPTKNNIGTKN